MSIRYCIRGAIAAVSLTLSVSGARGLSAQTGTVTGTITDATSGQPIGDASVSLAGTDLSRTTDLAGRYLLGGLPAGVYTVRVRAVGYGTGEQEVTVDEESTQVADFKLRVSSIDFDEVVITGMGAPVERRRLGTSLPTLTVGRIAETGPVGEFGQVLEGRIPGVRSTGIGGGLGAGRELAIRGADSFGYTRQRPAVYVDGVRVDAASEEWSSILGVSFGGFSGGAAEDRLSDLNPEEIDRIQVLKGPVAATLYGVTAASGVIEVFTRRGRRNTPATFNMNTGVGLQRLRANLPTTMRPDFPGPHGFAAWDPNQTLIENGLVHNYDLTVSGGGEDVAYFVSGGLARGEGSVKPNDQTRANIRVNLDWTATANTSISITSGYVRNRIRVLPSGNTWHSVYTTAMLSNPRSATEEEPYGGETIVNVVDAQEIETLSDTDRWTGRVRIDHNPGPRFAQQLLLGLDAVSEEKSRYLPMGRHYAVVGEHGERNLGHRMSRKITARYLSRYHYEDLLGLGFLTGALSVGAQSHWDAETMHVATGRNFERLDPSRLANALNQYADDRSSDETARGAFVQNRFDLSDDLFLTVALRADAHSNIGHRYGLGIYPKADFAYNVPRRALPGFVSGLKVRGAVGEAGKSPPRVLEVGRTFYSDGRTGYREVLADADTEPEDKREFEAGLDVGLVDDLIGLELTYYDARTKNALHYVNQPGSTGLNPGVRNCCEVMNRGVEADLAATPIDMPSLRWTTQIAYEWNRNRIVDLGPTAVDDSVAVYWQREDGTWEFSHWRHTRQQPGRFEGESVGDLLLYGIAGYDPATNTHTRTDHPFSHGSIRPTHLGSVFNSFQIGNHLRLSFQLRGEMGAVMANGDRSVGVRRLAHDEYLKHLGPDGESTRASDSVLDRHRTAYAVDKRDHIRLQQVALSYRLPDGVSAMLGTKRTAVTLSGYNLHWWDNCNCVDPGSPAFLTLPQPRRFVLSVRTRF